MLPVWSSAKNLTQKFEATLHLTYYTISLWMFLSLIVTVPLLATNSFPDIKQPAFMALFSAAGFSTFTLYFATLRAQKMSLIEKVPYLCVLVLMGYGISAKVSVEMLKGFFHKGGDWVRVPKFNMKKGQRIKEAYSSLKELPWLEFAMLAYTAAGIWYAFLNGNYGILLYLAVYFTGYFLVALDMLRF
jgi:hypothetical protein